MGSCGQHKDVYMYDVDYSDDIWDDDGDENFQKFKFHNTNYVRLRCCCNLENIKQLLDDVEHDIMNNYQNRGLSEADNTDTRFW